VVYHTVKTGKSETTAVVGAATPASGTGAGGAALFAGDGEVPSMPEGTRIAAVDAVPARGSYLFSVEDAFTNEREAILVPCEDEPGVEAWLNNCPHEDQRFDRGDGAAMRDGEIICPKHGSLFDACEGDCGNGPAAGSSLRPVEIAVEDGDVFLVDDGYTYVKDGGLDDDEGPSSTSHLSF
jgi:nitrite reductase/ring-hydroxylating ferredoxin subunit